MSHMLMIYTTLSSKTVTIKKKTLKRKVRKSLNREVGRSVSQSIRRVFRFGRQHPIPLQKKEKMETKGFL